MPKENKTKYAILGILSRTPMSGYDIKKITDSSIAHFWNENFGHIYPVLGRMEQEGLVSREIQHTSGRPDRSVYTPTDAGRAALADWLMREPEDPPTRIELLLQLFFAGTLPLPDVIEKVRKEKERTEERLAVFDAIHRHIMEYKTDQDMRDAPFWLITLSFGMHRARAAVLWCDETIETLVRLQATREKKTPGSG